MARKAVMILGMHRSGTSALAGLIMALGVDGPKKLLGPSNNNALGHFEPLELSKIQDRLLESSGSSWKDVRPFSEEWLDSETADLYQAELTTFLEESYDESPLFFLKDPRNCRLLELWKRVLKSKKIKPLYVLTHRNPVEVARSLERRDKLDLEYCYLLWLRHALDAEFLTRGAKRTFTSYRRIMEDWPAEVEKMSSDLGVTWPGYDFSNFPSIEEIIRPDLKRFSDDHIVKSSVFPAALKKTFAVLEQWAATGEQPSDYPILDRIRQEFDSSMPLFFPAVQMDRGALIAARDAVSKQVEAAQAETKARDETIAQTIAERDSARDTAETLKDERNRLSDELAVTASTLDQRKAELADTQDALRTFTAQFEEARREIAELSEKLASKEAEAEEMRGKLALSNTDLGRLQARLVLDASERDVAHKKIQQELAQSKARVLALEQSTSWRITGPMRWIVQHLRK